MKPLLSALGLWRRHEERVIEVLQLALSKLGSESSLPLDENPINRRLCFCIRRANRELSQRGRGLVCPFFYEAHNQPTADDKKRAAREHKRPDFQCGFANRMEPDPDRADMFFVIECKRLGCANRTDWVFNVNYVAHGICRFVEADHGYGKGAPSGAMVGYIQSMEPAQILQEVNDNAQSRRLKPLQLSPEGWQYGGTAELSQVLCRPAVPPTPFELRHLWVDLRTQQTGSAHRARGPAARSRPRRA